MPDSKKKQLNSSAKAFVPQSQLKASAAAWVPSPSDNASNNKSPSSDSHAPPVTNTKQTTTTVENITTTTTTTASTATSTEASTTTNNNIPSVAPTAGAWGKRPSEAIRTAPTQPPITNIPTNTTNKEKDSSSKHHHNHGKKGGGGGGDGKDNHHHHHHHHNHGQQHAGHNNRRGTRGGRSKGGDSSQNDASDENWSRGASLPVDLYQPGDEGERKIIRITADALLALRLLCLDPPSSWNSSSTTTTKEGAVEDDANNNNFAEHWKWTTDTRVQDIEAIVNNTGGNGTSGDNGGVNTPPSPGGSGGRRKGGGNSKGKQDGNNDTAPSLDDCKPLEVNEETRWKAKVFSNTNNASNTTEDESSTTNEDSDDIVLKKSLLILNKLSLTKFDKLSDSFIESGIGRNEKCLTGAIELIVNKAQDEPHFSAMYAALCLKLSRTPMEFEKESMNEGSGSSSSKGGKKFKKMLLAQCQKEFEQDTETKIANAIQNVEDEDEKQYIADVFKKHYLGHMRFIGELYKSDLINIKIMQFVLANLLDIDDDDEDETQGEEGGASGKNKAVDEEKVECFAKLMSTIGFSLEQQSNSMKSVGKTDAFKKLQHCWEMVNTLINSNKDSGRNVSNRIKFMLQDLIEMRDNGWVKRRKEETAKTIAQIHKEAAKEAKRSSSSSNLVGMRRQSSSGDMRKIKEKPVVDADGFVQVSSSSGISKSLSMGNISRSSSSEMRSSAPPKKDGSMKRVSSGGAFAAFNESSSSSRRASTGSYRKEKSDSKLPNVEEQKEANVNRIEYKSPEECGTKIKTILKEFFVSGDIDDATLSVHELIGAGAEGSIDRGMKVLESGIMLVLEMKQEEVDKFNKLVLRCLNEKKIEKDAIVSGLNYPLELLSDISIDAPLASSHLTSIITELIKSGAVSFDFFLNSPEYFRTDCGAAQFSCKVLKKLGGEAMQDATNLEVVDKLMTDFDKGTFATAKDLLDA